MAKDAVDDEDLEKSDSTVKAIESEEGEKRRRVSIAQEAAFETLGQRPPTSNSTSTSTPALSSENSPT